MSVNRFSENELVLCFEPDTSKAKVLYDAKVLQVVSRKDNRKNRRFEYLIHFQGWNSSWDRFVAEEFVLKDTEENRKLQSRLYEEAQVLKNAMKKKKRTLGEALKDIGRRRCTSVPSSDRQDDESSKSSFSDAEGLDDSSEEDYNEENDGDEDDNDNKETLPLVIPEDIKRRLENDFHFVTLELRMVRVPASPCVVKILEDYVKYFGLKELLDWADRVKRQTVTPPPIKMLDTTPPVVPALPPASLNAKTSTSAPLTGIPSLKLQEEPKRDELKLVLQRIYFVREIVDGLRLMFDFLVGRILLYKQEARQFAKSKRFKAQSANEACSSVLQSLITKCKNEFEEDVELEKDDEPPPPTKRLTRTSKALAKSTDHTSVDDALENLPSSSSISSRGRVSSSELNPTAKEKRSPSPDSKRRACEYTREILDWKLLPVEEYNVKPPHPSLIYGSIHLMRLFVKMPEILSKTTIPRRRLRILVGHINKLLAFVAKYDSGFEKRSLYYRNGEEQKTHEQQSLS